MATHDVDQTICARLAKQASDANPALSGALYRILGLSVLLSRRLINARKIRRDRAQQDERTETLSQHIIWTAREGLQITELYIAPHVTYAAIGAEYQVFTAKLRSSFYHIFCLFHNDPPVRVASPSPSAGSHGSRDRPVASFTSIESVTRERTPKTPKTPTENTPPSNSKGKGKMKEDSPPSARPRGKKAGRDPIESLLSDESENTNPYGTLTALSPPPGFAGTTHTPIRNTNTFLLPSVNFMPTTTGAFIEAAQLAATLLPGSSPLRLSINLEYCGFLWDCLHDHQGCRHLASRSVRAVYKADETLSDQEFSDAKLLVGALGRMMRRQSGDATPKLGIASPGNLARTGEFETPSPAVKIEDILMYDEGDTPPRPPPKNSPSTPSIARKPVGTPSSTLRAAPMSSSSIPVPIRRSQ